MLTRCLRHSLARKYRAPVLRLASNLKEALDDFDLSSASGFVQERPMETVSDGRD